MTTRAGSIFANFGNAPHHWHLAHDVIVNWLNINAVATQARGLCYDSLFSFANAIRSRGFMLRRVKSAARGLLPSDPQASRRISSASVISIPNVLNSWHEEKDANHESLR